MSEAIYDGRADVGRQKTDREKEKSERERGGRNEGLEEVSNRWRGCDIII